VIRNETHIAITEEQLWHILEEVKDPEVPVLSIIDLGIVRDVKVENEKISIIITPTYSGCPAMDVISMDIRLKLIEKGYRNVVIQQQLSPAWTTDWMTSEGKEKLKALVLRRPIQNNSSVHQKCFAKKLLNVLAAFPITRKSFLNLALLPAKPCIAVSIAKKPLTISNVTNAICEW
jgi:ring-1,2-phenylacetyl-CoA epoxidase subunit PaaD